MKKLFLILTILLLFLLGGCQTKQDTVTCNGMFFDTVISVTVYDTPKKTLEQDIMEFCRKYDNLLSRTNPESEISKINSAQGNPTKVSPETIEILEKSIEYSQLTGGAFDITIGPLVDLWDFKKSHPTLPDQKDIDEALSHVDYTKIKIDKDTVTLEDPLAKIDLGGIAKGYIGDQLKTFLKEQGIQTALINLGGNIVVFGEKSDHSPFHIGIQKPFDETGTPITSMEIRDASLVTSGVYERYFEFNQTLYHHLLDPKTGMPSQSPLYSATILCESSAQADALSTACFVLGVDQSKELITQLKDVTAIFITDDNQIKKLETID